MILLCYNIFFYMITNVLGTPDDHRSDPPDVPTYEQAWQGCDLAYPKPN